MSRMNELLAARLSRGTRSLLGLQEQEGLTVVSPELVPVIDINAPEIEIMGLMGWVSYCSAVITVGGGGAGTRSRIHLRAPAGSGAIQEIQHVWFEHGTVGGLTDLNLRDALSAGGTQILTTPNDRRHLKRATLQIVSFNDALPAGGTNMREQRQAAATGFVDVMAGRPVLMIPGVELMCFGPTDNAAVTAWVIFRERVVREDELVV